MTFDIEPLTVANIPSIVTAFAKAGWEKPFSLFHMYLHEQEEGKRLIWVAFQNDVIFGYVTLKWLSDYQPFRADNIPEISDLNVLPKFRKQGIATKLLDLAEAAAFKRSSIVGIGVGLYADYGHAQKLYIRRGYIPDGGGITYKNKAVCPGQEVAVDDELVLWLMKRLAS